jgi:aryl-alcohol dehydrogenase-like predicted oxidoreductase
MRLSTADADEASAVETIAAAAGAAVTIFDTARAYGHGSEPCGQNERLVASALRRCGAAGTARIVTKGGMTRPDGAWVPDGRARSILRDCESSLRALDGLPIDLYLLHSPDPRTPWSTSMRALARLLDEHLVRRVGIANVNRDQLDEALQFVPVAAVQVAMSVENDGAVRGGLVERCSQRGITLMAHSPFDGPRRAARVGRHLALLEVAERRAVTPAEVALAWLLDISPAVVAIPGARRPDTARSAARAARLVLDPQDRHVLARAFGSATRRSTLRPRVDGDREGHGEVVLVMGIPGAGKTHLAADYVSQGYSRLNRDERGGSLRDLCGELDSALASGSRRVVLDNTWLTRGARSHVIEVAARHDVPVRCIWLDTPLAQAQLNLVARMIDSLGHLPGPEELRASSRRVPGMLAPTAQMRSRRELEAPSTDEGLAAVETVPFSRNPRQRQGAVGVLVAGAVVQNPGWELALAGASPASPHLVFDWRPGEDPDTVVPAVARVSTTVGGPVEGALCTHPAGPPVCWCRPPLPGLVLAFAQARGVDLSRSFVIGVSAAHRSLATAVGAVFIQA